MNAVSTIDEIKRAHPLHQVMESYGLQLKRNGSSVTFKTKCPFHEDDTPSLSINTQKEGGLWNCFGCNCGGDVISFVEKIEGISTKEAINKLSEKVGSSPNPSSSDEIQVQKIEVSDDRRAELLKEIVRVYHQSFKETRSAQEYLEKRGLKNKALWEHYQIGFCDGSQLKKMLPQEGLVLEELKEIGVFNDKGNETFYRSVVFPIFSLNDGPASALYGRSTNFSRHLYTKGRRGGVWNGEAVKSHHTIILTESILDSYSLVELGFASIPLYGTNGLTKAHLELFESSSIKEIILMLDNDDAGLQAMPEVLEKLRPLNIKVSSASLPEGVKDPNQFLVEGGTKKELGAILEKRHRLFDPTSTAPEESETNPIISKGNDFVTVQYGDLTYETRGFRSTFSDTLRVVISVHLNEESRHTDRIDLYTARNRKSFANACSNKFDLQSAKIEQDLLSLIQLIEKIQRENTEKKASEVKEDEPYQMTREEEQEALEFLRRPDLIKQIVRDLESIGYIGESKAKLLTYLSATSRIDQPISLTVRANAGSGKSVLFEKVCQLMPPEAVKFYSRISAQSLFYMKRTELKNKILVIDEKAGSAESDYSLRNLMSRGKLSLAVVSRDYETGESKTISVEMEGPVAVFESTTASEMNVENLSRVFEIWLSSNSTEQTKKILDAQLNEYSLEAIKKKDDIESITRVHQNAQRLLKPLKVVIPFKIEFPSQWATRVRRDYKRFLTLISTITQLHQYARKVHKAEEASYLIATKEDYRIAYELVKDILQSTLCPLQKEVSDLLKLVVEYVEATSKKEGVDPMDFAFTRKEIRDHARWSASKARSCLEELCQLEYIEKVTGRAKATFRYRLLVGQDEIQNLAVLGLTRPEDLEEIQI